MCLSVFMHRARVREIAAKAARVLCSGQGERILLSDINKTTGGIDYERFN